MSPIEKQHRLKVVAAFACVYVLWGSTYLAMRIVVEHIPPAMMGGIRFLASGGIMMTWCALSGRKLRVTRAEFIRLAIIGVLLLGTGNVMVAWGEQYVPSGLAALVVAAVPLWVALIESFILKSERLRSRGMFGLALGAVGLGVLLWPQLHASSTVGRSELIGCLGLIFAALCWASGSILSRRSQLNVDPFTATAYEMTIAGVVNLAISLAHGDLAHTVLTARGIGAIVYLVIGGSLIGFTAFIWLLEHVPTSKVATYAYVNPIVAVALGALVLHETVDAWIVAGTAVIIGGVVLVTTSKIHPGDENLPAKTQLPACEAEG